MSYLFHMLGGCKVCRCNCTGHEKVGHRLARDFTTETHRENRENCTGHEKVGHRLAKYFTTENTEKILKNSVNSVGAVV
jgi:hypothetical protein